MAIRNIPVDKTSPDQEFTIDLEGTVYIFRLLWNDRTGRWSLNISLEDGTALLTGVAVVGDSLLLVKRFKDERLPLGRLFTFDSTEQGREPDDENFGDDVKLLYQDSTDEDFVDE